MNQNVKILGRRLHSPSLKDVAFLQVAKLFFFIFHTFVSKFFSREPRLDVCLPIQIYRQMYGKLEKLAGRLAKLLKVHMVTSRPFKPCLEEPIVQH